MSASPATDQTAWSTTCFDVSIAHNVAHLKLNRPGELNSMIPAF